MALGPACSGPVGAQRMDTPNDNMEWLTNPELINEGDIIEFTRHIADLLTAPSKNAEGKDLETQRMLKQEAGFFAKFINDQATNDIYRSLSGKIYVRMPRYMDADLKQSLLKTMINSYVKLAREWEKIGLKAPRGFIFVWIISDIDKMWQEFDIDRNIMAFALPCRYMVVPYQVISENMKYGMEARAFFENGNPHEMRAAIDKYLQKSFTINFAHELTHIFTFSEMGFRRINSLDKWFYEGAAIWLSRDNGAGLADEYKDYKMIFDFIRMKYGNQRFQQFIRDGVQTSVPDSLKQNLGLPHYRGLVLETRRWYARMRWAEILLSILAAFCFGLVVGRWMKAQPAYLCYWILFQLIAVYGWVFGYYHLWTNSIPGSLVFNWLGLMVALFPVLIYIRFIYYNFRLRREIRMAESLEPAEQAMFQYPVEFENYRYMLELARLNQARWTPWEGIGWARDAARMAGVISGKAHFH